MKTQKILFNGLLVLFLSQILLTSARKFLEDDETSQEDEVAQEDEVSQDDEDAVSELEDSIEQVNNDEVDVDDLRRFAVKNNRRNSYYYGDEDETKSNNDESQEDEDENGSYESTSLGGRRDTSARINIKKRPLEITRRRSSLEYDDESDEHNANRKGYISTNSRKPTRKAVGKAKGKPAGKGKYPKSSKFDELLKKSMEKLGIKDTDLKRKNKKP